MSATGGNEHARNKEFGSFAARRAHRGEVAVATYLIRHAPHLSGEVEVSAAKNAVLPILAAGLLTEDPLIIKEVPRITDVDTLLQILRDCGAEVVRSGSDVSVCALQPQSPQHEENMRRLRASILILGPILTRSGSACVGLPGGCAIGQRPIDLHVKGLQGLGAQVYPLGGKRQLSGKLTGARIYLDLPSVGATENLMMAATLAQGQTTLENAAKEPEIVDLANCLNQMGACITGAGTGTVSIMGVERLHGAIYHPIPDRVEAGTLLCAAAISEGSVLVRGACAEHMRSLLFKLLDNLMLVRNVGDGCEKVLAVHHGRKGGAQVLSPLRVGGHAVLGVEGKGARAVPFPDGALDGGVVFFRGKAEERFHIVYHAGRLNAQHALEVWGNVDGVQVAFAQHELNVLARLLLCFFEDMEVAIVVAVLARSE
mgnify:CR=1 FL=1